VGETLKVVGMHADRHCLHVRGLEVVDVLDEHAVLGQVIWAVAEIGLREVRKTVLG
jgi:hypothetical protein